MTDQAGLGKQALDKVAEMAIKSQLDHVEHVDVDVKAEPLDLLQGKVDSVSIEGTGMVMKQALRVEALKVNADSMSINPLKALTGEIELTQPTNAQAQILITEADLNRALASDYLLRKMQGLKISVQGEGKTVDIQKAEIHLPGDDKLALNVALLVQESGDRPEFSAVAIPSLKEAGQKIDLKLISAEGQDLSIDFATALFNEVIELLDLRNFELDGISLQLQSLIVQKGTLLLQAATTIEKLPAA